jgi:hypothetical protein
MLPEAAGVLHGCLFSDGPSAPIRLQGLAESQQKLWPLNNKQLNVLHLSCGSSKWCSTSEHAGKHSNREAGEQVGTSLEAGVCNLKATGGRQLEKCSGNTLPISVPDWSIKSTIITTTAFLKRTSCTKPNTFM